MAIAALYFVVVLVCTIVFVFQTGILFALSFLGTTALPLIAVAAGKWGIARGDKQQKIGIPIIALILVAAAYWLSLGVSITLFQVHLSGLALLVVSGAIGLLVPLDTAE